jgi:2-polyprenyl-3-methyl-5-hydroxy-6-metoxy-1,4-benzoquinol methylase
VTTVTERQRDYVYVGNELDLFADAANWKRYWASQIREFLGARIAEVGAGIGANMALLGKPGQEWTCVEPDSTLAARIEARIRAREFSFPCRVTTGTCADLEIASYDSILYIDVLEHIADDRAEVNTAAQRLRSGGHLITLSPAHPYLYSPFDAAIGHHRRYERATILALAPRMLTPVRVRYLDAVGMLASLANRLVLKSPQPTAANIRLWDRLMVPLSRIIDPITGHRLGKSVLCVWRRI